MTRADINSRAFLPLLLIITSCAQKEGDQPAPKDTSAKETAAKVRPISLNGQWRVTALNGRPMDPRQFPIFLTANGTHIYASSQCIWWYWSHRTQKNRFSATPVPRLIKAENGESLPPPMCARGLHSLETSFQKAVESANQITAISPSTLGLDGNGTSLTLERRPGIEGRWTVMAINNRPLDPSDYPIHLDISDQNITATSQCVQLFWTYQRTGARLETQPTRRNAPICERSRTAAETKLEAIMGKLTLWRSLSDHGLYVLTGKETVTLQPQL